MAGKYRIETQWGDFLVAFGDDGRLRNLQLPGAQAGQESRPLLGNQEGEAGEKLRQELLAYLAGQSITFTTRVDLKGTSFQLRVWSALGTVPWGETRTYGQLAELCAAPRAARAVGSACGANPIAIVIPCHRILAASGLGGYGGGLQWKKRLLALEHFACPQG
jgi:methylated-DNA-[protein]-cysteine S-methyltransferase